MMADSKLARNPFENSKVLDRLFGFLPGRELLNCRLVNKKWNSSAIQRLQHLAPFNIVNLFVMDAPFRFLKFLGSRSKSVDWYETSLTYKMYVTPPGELQRDVGLMQALVNTFGPACIQSLNVELNEAPDVDPFHEELIGGRISQEALELIYSQVGQLVAGAVLPTLTIDVCICDWMPGCKDQLQIEYIHRLLNAPAGIRELIFKGVSFDKQFPRQVLTQLQNVRQEVLNSIEVLHIQVNGKECFEILQNVSLIGLRELRVEWDTKIQGRPTANDVIPFRELLLGFPLLTLCSVWFPRRNAAVCARQMFAMASPELPTNLRLEFIDGAFVAEEDKDANKMAEIMWSLMHDK